MKSLWSKAAGHMQHQHGPASDDPIPEIPVPPAPPAPVASGRMEVLRELGLAVQYVDDAQPDSVQAGPVQPGRALCALRAARHTPSGHTPLWAYNSPAVAKPFFGERAEEVIFEELPPGLSLDELAGHTRLFIFLGAAQTEALTWALARTDLLVLVFEPENARVEKFCQGLDLRRLTQAKVIFVGGEAVELMPFLSAKLTQSLRTLTQPAFLVQDGIEAEYSRYVKEVVLQMELLYYRARIYPVEGQWGCRSLPIRPIMRDLFYDQLANLYANLTRFVTAGNARHLRGTMTGHTALLVAPGPDMDAKMHYIHKHRNKAVVIAVSRALKPLLAAGITPHFVIINDNSLDAASPLMDIPPQEECVLVAQCLSPLGADAFAKTFFFGNILPHLFPERADLRLHASVITAAFSLARLLGCRRAVIVGGQLASYDPWTFGYAKKSAEDLALAGPQPSLPLIGRFPQLIPVTAASGKTMYTTPNYLDASVWFKEEVRRTGIEVVNACADSILSGGPIRVEENWPIPEGPDPREAVKAIVLARDPHDLAPIEDFILAQLSAWGNTKRASENTVAQMRAEHSAEPGAHLLSIFDANNTTYLVERFTLARDLSMEDLDGAMITVPAGSVFFTPWFNKYAFQEESPDMRLRVFIYYFSVCAVMSESLCLLLSARLHEIRELRARYGDRA